MNAFKQVTKLVIDRTKWLRRGKNGKGYLREGKLRNEQGCMCCLGFLSLALGFSKEQITSRSMVAKIEDAPSFVPFLSEGFSSTKFGNDAALANDSECRSAPELEDYLHNLFEKQGIELTFVGQKFEERV